MKISTKNLAISASYAALYVALVVALGPFSYGPLQIRVAGALLAIVPLLGITGVLGHTLGVFVANLFSTLGPIDLLNTIPSLAMAFVVYYLYKLTQNEYTIIGTCTAYSIVLSITVGTMLSSVSSLPLLPTIVYVFAGNFIASVLIGWPLFKLLKKTEALQRWVGTYENKDQILKT
ncbi:MAG: QueT transporter family protein [Candidatus Bathyarchaeia archaeon]